jgi:hypothetical protein
VARSRKFSATHLPFNNWRGPSFSPHVIRPHQLNIDLPLENPDTIALIEWFPHGGRHGNVSCLWTYTLEMCRSPPHQTRSRSPTRHRRTSLRPWME